MGRLQSSGPWVDSLPQLQDSAHSTMNILSSPTYDSSLLFAQDKVHRITQAAMEDESMEATRYSRKDPDQRILFWGPQVLTLLLVVCQTCSLAWIKHSSAIRQSFFFFICFWVPSKDKYLTEYRTVEGYTKQNQPTYPKNLISIEL